MASAPRTLAVTGASTGFGRDIARLARAAGWRVIGTVRKEADAQALRAEGVDVAFLDLLDDASVARGCDEILRWCGGRLDAVVHNAGTSWPGPVELVTLADVRSQLQVNTIGHVDVTQRLLPAVRQARGRMVYISSDSVTNRPPMMGAYAASKAALEVFAEVLAQEVADQGVSVVVVAPGPYATAIWGTSMPRGEVYLTAGDPRLDLYRGLAERVSRLAMGRPMGDATDLARVVLRTLDDPSPPFRVVAPLQSRLQGVVRAVLPTRWWHGLVRRVLDRDA